MYIVQDMPYLTYQEVFDELKDGEQLPYMMFIEYTDIHGQTKLVHTINYIQ